jgi:hypothetical protein
MKTVWSNCMDYFQTDEAKRNLKESIIAPMGQIIYHEMYFYVWLICFYHIFLIFLILSILVMLLRVNSAQIKLLKL